MEQTRFRKALLGVALCWLGAAIFPAMAQTTTVAGITPGQFSVNESGAATYRIPIQVPPGVAGMEPKLELAYNSQGGNGLLGMGWSLGGLSAITRCARTLAQDNFRGSVNFDMNDRYCMDGQRLILVSGTYGAAGSEYRTELDSFSKIVASGTAGNGVASFTVQTKAGLTMEYGNTADSRIEAQGKPTVRVWAINKISDVKTNFMTFSYSEENVIGNYTPNRIDYGGNAAAGVASSQSVQWSYEARLDTEIGYQAGSIVKVNKRVTNLKMFNGASLVKDYRLAYSPQAVASNKSMLASVSECTATQCLPPLALQNANFGAPVFSAYSQALGDGIGDARGLMTGDVNGDGKTDLLYWLNGGPGIGLSVRTKMSNGDGTFTGYVQQLGDTVFDTYGVLSGDVNGDGKTDLIYWYHGGPGVGLTVRTKMSNGDGTFTGYEQVLGDGVGGTYGITTGDVNGDGKTDLIYWFDAGPGYGLTVRVKMSNGDGTFTGYSQQLGDGVGGTYGITTGDVNGDGKTDLIYWFDAGPGYGLTVRTKMSNGDGTFTGYQQVQGDGVGGTYGITTGDINGDGKTDLIYWLNGGPGVGLNVRVKMSNGDGTFSAYSQQLGDTVMETFGITAADVNGDGKSDLIYWFDAGPGIGLTVRSKISNGDGSFTGYEQVMGDGVGGYGISTGDVNGDGKTDLIYWLNGGPGVGLTVRTKMPSTSATGVLTGITDSVGKNTNWTYGLLTNSAVYAKDTAPNAAVYPKLDLQYAQYVVSTVVGSNGIGGTTTTQYGYGGLKAELGTGRGMLGFRWMKSKNLSNNIESYTEFNQNWPFTGTVFKSETRLAGSGNAGVLKRTTNTYAQGTGSAAGTTFFYPSQSIEESWDLGGSQYPTVTNSYQYGQSPQYGDPTQITVSNNAGGSKSTVNEYWPVNTASGNWILGRLKKATVSSVTP